ncbi:ATP-binding protein [Sporolactobacillus kofuensis]|uniref:histidine kinase n=1 Tax=Sporolactobacillus kofuensis TaxID=269672 RepID=A0ABW1WEM4_9BACL|nr:ATP-binding protein [Sporolactobacillus kofuensis]
MQRLFSFFIVLLCYIGLSCIFISWNHDYEDNLPTAKNGILDLTHWNFEKGGNAVLNGMWTFYPNQLLTPKSIENGNGKNAQLTVVPNQSLKEDPKRHLASGTYRLLIRSKQGGKMMGIRTTAIYSTNRLYMNGRLIGQSGKPALRNSEYPSLRPYVTYFPIKKGLNELIVQTSRADGSAGFGIAKPIFMGIQSKITYSHDIILFNDMLMIISFFFMSLYFFGYYFQRRKDIHLLFFSSFCLLFAVVISWISQGRVIYLFFPNLSLGGLTIIESFSTIAISLSVFLYLYYAYPKLVSKLVTKVSIVWALVTVSLDFLPFDRLTPIELLLHTVLAIGTIFYASYIFVLAIINKVEGSIYLTIGAFAMSVFVIIATINIYSSKVLSSIYSVSSLIFLLMLSLVMSKRFSIAFKRSESLAAELIRNDQLKDEFIAKTSHEFRTPLNGIINTAQTLLAGSRNRTISDEADKLQMITRISYRLSALVNDILDLEKIKQGNLRINLIPLDVATTVTTELAFYKLTAEKKGLSLSNTIPTDLPLIHADENRFRQILNNLVDNAVKYTQSGQITLSADLLEHEVEIRVADTGSGIPNSELASIFNAFERRERLNQSEGAGLGLNIVKQLVEIQKGRIWLDSEVGVGSTFHFTMPLFNPDQGVAPGASVRVPSADFENQSDVSTTVDNLVTPYLSPTVQAPKILVVDDDIENLKILIDMLEGIPYNVVAVKNGSEALNIVKHEKLDLVILDLMMPGLSGFDVCREIREQYSLVDLPVLMLTAAIINGDKHYALRSGANDILQKPYNFSEFSARIRGLILMKQAAGQATNMEVAFLQSQIRPHFLYNVLNSIIALSYEDVEKSREMTAAFAAYLRGSFDFQNTSAMSTLRKELSLVRSYLTIEKMRFQDRIDAVIDVDDSLNFPIPPLMIQPLVENAIRHGIAKKKAGGRLTLSVKPLLGASYLVTVSDNGVGMDEKQIKQLLLKERSGGVGLKNINERLKHYYGTELMIQSTVRLGTTVSYRLSVDESQMQTDE